MRAESCLPRPKSQISCDRSYANLLTLVSDSAKYCMTFSNGRNCGDLQIARELLILLFADRKYDKGTPRSGH